MLEEAGFADVVMVTETGFNSSPLTKGVLIRAGKPIATEARREDKMEYLVRRALELGAEKAKVIDVETVVMAEWVSWKCQYGCPLFEKNPFHPPFAPEVESTKKVLKEYTKAILLNGPDGETLTEAAVKLEGEAYHQGYYKAFALTALVPGGAALAVATGPAASPGVC